MLALTVWGDQVVVVPVLGPWRHCLSRAEEPAGAEQHSPTEAFLRGGAPTAAGGLFSDGP